MNQVTKPMTKETMETSTSDQIEVELIDLRKNLCEIKGNPPFNAKLFVVNNTLIVTNCYEVRFKRTLTTDLIKPNFQNSWMITARPNFNRYYVFAYKHKLDILFIPKYKGHFPYSKYFKDRNFLSISALYFEDTSLANIDPDLIKLLAESSYTGLPDRGWLFRYDASISVSQLVYNYG